MGPALLEDRGDKQFKHKNIDRKWMEKSIKTFEDNKVKGKLPYLWDRHNSEDVPALVIGRLDNLRIQELDGKPWLFAEVIITDPAHQQKFLDGKSPSKSVEFQPDNFYMRGLSLLDGFEGRFDFEIPDFVPEGLYEELVAMGADAKNTVLCHAAANTATGEAMLTKDELKAMLAENNAELLKSVDAKLAANKPTVNNASGDVMADLQKVRDEERANANVMLAKKEREATVKAYTAQLSAKTKTPENLLKRKLESFTTQEGMDEYFKASMKAAEEDVKLGVEREHGDSPDLREEYEAFKQNYPDTKQNFESFCRVAKSLTPEALEARRDRHEKRGAVAVHDDGVAFA